MVLRLLSPFVYTFFSFITLVSSHSPHNPPTHSKGCTKPLPAGLSPGGPSVNFTVFSPEGGGERRYLVHLPEGFSRENDRPAPVVMAFHGFGQPTASMEEITGLSEDGLKIAGRDVVAVYPEGVNNVWLGDPGAHNLTTLDDRPFVLDLLTHLTSTLCIDPTRIYATGFSNGGGLAGLLACYPPTANRIAAFAGVAAAYYTEESLGYSLFERGACPKRNVWNERPFLDIHGEKDMVIAYDGDNSKFDVDENGIPDPDTLDVRAWLGDWAWRNGCGERARPKVRGARELAEDVVETSWRCRGEKDVVVGYKVAGLGHGWPSTVQLDEFWESFRLGPQTWNASRVLVEWFGRWRLD